MDWSGLAGAASDTVIVAFTFGAAVSPPDPFTQLVYVVPSSLVGFPILHRYREPAGRWWVRYVVFLGGVLAVALAGRLLAFAEGVSSAAVRPALLTTGVALGAWLAFLGGSRHLRGGFGA